MKHDVFLCFKGKNNVFDIFVIHFCIFYTEFIQKFDKNQNLYSNRFDQFKIIDCLIHNSISDKRAVIEWMKFFKFKNFLYSHFTHTRFKFYFTSFAWLNSVIENKRITLTREIVLFFFSKPNYINLSGVCTSKTKYKTKLKCETRASKQLFQSISQRPNNGIMWNVLCMSVAHTIKAKQTKRTETNSSVHRKRERRESVYSYNDNWDKLMWWAHTRRRNIEYHIYRHIRMMCNQREIMEEKYA